MNRVPRLVIHRLTPAILNINTIENIYRNADSSAPCLATPQRCEELGLSPRSSSLSVVDFLFRLPIN